MSLKRSLSQPAKEGPLQTKKLKHSIAEKTQTKPRSTRGTSKVTKTVHGNYKHYYSRRSGRDPRLSAFNQEAFSGKHCLDIGTNAGLIPLEIATQFNILSVCGIDIDPDLIKQCHKNKKVFLYDRRTQMAQHVTFEHCDITQGQPGVRSRFDVITCLSVIKWIHINQGDAYLSMFFAKIYSLLSPGGRFYLEAQPWSSYNKKKLFQEGVQKMKLLKVRPTEFPSMLEACGFVIVKEHSIDSGGKFKNRNILECMRPLKETSGDEQMVTGETSQNSSSGSSSSINSSKDV